MYYFPGCSLEFVRLQHFYMTAWNRTCLLQSSNWMFSLDCGREFCLPHSNFNQSLENAELFRVCIASGLNEQCVLNNKMLQYLKILIKCSKNCLEKKKNHNKKASVSWKKKFIRTSYVFHQYFQWMAFLWTRQELVKIIRVKDKKNFYLRRGSSKYLFLEKELVRQSFKLSSCLVVYQFI